MGTPAFTGIPPCGKDSAQGPQLHTQSPQAKEVASGLANLQLMQELVCSQGCLKKHLGSKHILVR